MAPTQVILLSGEDENHISRTRLKSNPYNHLGIDGVRCFLESETLNQRRYHRMVYSWEAKAEEGTGDRKIGNSPRGIAVSYTVPLSFFSFSNSVFSV